MADVKSILQWSLSPKNWSQYGKVWNEYESFAWSILEIPAALPILPFQAVLFFASLHQKGLAASTIRSAGSAISFLHKLQGMPDMMGSFLVTKFFRDFQIQLSPTTSSCRLQGPYCTGCCVPSQ